MKNTHYTVKKAKPGGFRKAIRVGNIFKTNKMKKQLKQHFVFMAILAFVFLSCSSQEQGIIGEWRDADPDAEEEFSITFDRKGYVYLQMDNETIGGPGWEQEEEGLIITMSMKYEIDDSHDPAWIDLVMYVEGFAPADPSVSFTPEEQQGLDEYQKAVNEMGMRAKGIFNMISDTRMEIEVNFEGWDYIDSQFVTRPNAFDPDGEAYSVLEKVVK